MDRWRYSESKGISAQGGVRMCPLLGEKIVVTWKKVLRVYKERAEDQP